MPTKFTAQDRCDGCSARARYYVLLESGGSVQLCGHHMHNSKDALEKQGALILEPEVDHGESD